MSEDRASYGPEPTVAQLQAQVTAYRALVQVLQAQAWPDPTQAEDPHVDRLVDLIQRSLAYGGCSNCGGLPHSTTCRVGRLAAAFQVPALVTHREDCRKVRCRNTNDAICDLCACTCQPPHLIPRDLSNPCGDGHIWFTLRGLTPLPDERCVCQAVTWAEKV
jgi:hypothetical protein